ncbi:hypothetical protein GJ496_004762 [Pomphorhynchus laevis]|nr:hypothetical protein GJ496_004762 [Pomphorhynchus laevis]
MNSVIKEEPRFYLQHRPLTNQKLYEAAKSNRNEHDMLLSQAKSNYSQQLINAAAAVVSSPSTYPNSRHQQQQSSFNQQNVQTSINLNSLLQQHHPALASHQHMYIKQLLLDQQLKSATNNSGNSNLNVDKHQFYPNQHQRNQLQNNSHQHKRKHSDDDELDDDEDNVGDGGGGSAKMSHNNTFPQFDGQVDDQSIGRTRPLDAPISGEDTSDEDDDELDRFASVIAPEFSESNDTFVTKEDSEPLNSDDDVSEDDPTDLFDTDNIVVCQFDKINRSKARWKFLLKEGIMNIRGKDYVFSKAQGEADW